MGRSNNQLRRTAKATGKTFTPKASRSKSKNLAQKQKAEYARKHEKVAYGKTRNARSGQVKQRMFRSGGYNASGQFGRAKGAKRMMAKKGGSGGGKKK
ncbi:Hypothetical protein, putative [Bodo saltans]|uniref:Uncharacterized protein n=1 Tax=Bodo saltans TaxID=75058 RepID=A0A0S4JJD5_BODSA|nr:Hypothetical protein, putative [Bodo saltans]|eukprot:CUG90190.1 Hypothetical protein, putative [Bodo saltans]